MLSFLELAILHEFEEVPSDGLELESTVVDTRIDELLVLQLNRFRLLEEFDVEPEVFLVLLVETEDVPEEAIPLLEADVLLLFFVVHVVEMRVLHFIINDDRRRERELYLVVQRVVRGCVEVACETVLICDDALVFEKADLHATVGTRDVVHYVHDGHSETAG